LLLSLAPEAPLALALPELTKADLRIWEMRLNQEWTACGCRAGEIAAMLAIAAYVSAAALGAVPAVASTWGHAGWALLAALAAAAAGKVVGRVRSLSRFRRLAREIGGAIGARSLKAAAEEARVAIRDPSSLPAPAPDLSR
jgi:VIT1/CCC1 family predicted Fe2+/Mn2+ transporter